MVAWGYWMWKQVTVAVWQTCVVLLWNWSYNSQQHGYYFAVCVCLSSRNNSKKKTLDGFSFSFRWSWWYVVSVQQLLLRKFVKRWRSCVQAKLITIKQASAMSADVHRTLANSVARCLTSRTYVWLFLERFRTIIAALSSSLPQDNSSSIRAYTSKKKNVSQAPRYEDVWWRGGNVDEWSAWRFFTQEGDNTGVR
jgi:hypothetical protein